MAPPQFEALTPRSRTERSAPPPPSATPALPDDPFGLGEVNATERHAPAAPPPPLIEPTPGDEPALAATPVAADRPFRSTPPAAPVAGPAAGPAHPAAPKDGGALLAAFLEGAGMDAERMAPEDPEAFMRDAGRAFARLSEGLRELLQVRATIKEHVRADKTQIGAAQNNPLKYSISPREATAALLRRREQGYLAPLPAIEASFRDLKAHELGLLEGLQSAVGELLGSFDPATLEQRLGDAGALSTLLQGGRRARLWELYAERYEELAKGAKTRFMGHFDGVFRAAYARKSAEVSAASTTSDSGESR
jgi:type VI secretion system FHA domain protein